VTEFLSHPRLLLWHILHAANSADICTLGQMQVNTGLNHNQGEGFGVGSHPATFLCNVLLPHAKQARGLVVVLRTSNVSTQKQCTRLRFN